MKKANASISASNGETPKCSPPVDGLGVPDMDFIKGFRRAPDFEGALPTKKPVTRVLLGRPNPQHFIRVSPQPDHRDIFPILLLSTENKKEGERYLVSPVLYDQLTEEERTGSYNAQLYYYITRSGTVGLWDIKLPTTGVGTNWLETARAVMEDAMHKWVRVISDREAGAYRPVEASSQYVEPVWPEEQYLQLVAIAFRDRFITALDHPVLKHLRGE
jgi:hypothetical protein